MDARLDPNQSENGKYNLISGWFDKISKTFLCVERVGNFSMSVKPISSCAGDLIFCYKKLKKKLKKTKKKKKN